MQAHQLRRGGSLLTGLLVACLAAIGIAQADLVGAECETVREVVDVSKRVILNAAALQALENDVQPLANCIPRNGVLEFDLSELVLDESIEIKSPITIRGNEASVQCPNDPLKGAFKIRSDDVSLSGLVFKGCFLNSTFGLIDVQKSKNVTLYDVECMGNKNVAGPAGLSAVQSGFRLLNVEARNNSGLWGSAVHLNNSNVTIVESTFENNTARHRGGAIFAEAENSTQETRFADSNIVLITVTFSGSKPIACESNEYASSPCIVGQESVELADQKLKLISS